jgi:hypothetical protein
VGRYAPTIGSHPNQSNEWMLRNCSIAAFSYAVSSVNRTAVRRGETLSEFHQRVVNQFNLESKRGWWHKAGAD